jgi:hypothetical protein
MKLRSVTLALAALTIAGVAGAAGADSKPPFFNVDKQGVALHGYDVVSYFDGLAPVKGNPTIAYNFMGAIWRFSTADNRKKFAQARTKYLPQYGGYCAKGVSEKKLVDVDPLAYKIVDGKLYLNYDKSVQKTWEEDIPGRIAQANANWPTLHAAQ